MKLRIGFLLRDSFNFVVQRVIASCVALVPLIQRSDQRIHFGKNAIQFPPDLRIANHLMNVLLNRLRQRMFDALKRAVDHENNPADDEKDQAVHKEQFHGNASA